MGYSRRWAVKSGRLTELSWDQRKRWGSSLGWYSVNSWVKLTETVQKIQSVLKKEKNWDP